MSQFTAKPRAGEAQGSRAEGLSRRFTVLLSVAAGAIAANLYYAQPLLEAMSRSLHTSPGAVATIVTAGQLGFAVGLVFVLPLADLVKRRWLLSGLLLLDAAALTAASVARSMPLALTAFGVLGLANVAAQVLIPTAAQLARDDQRGRVVATVISGLLTGMLLARTVAGVVTSLVGWRLLFLGAAVLMLIVNIVLFRALRDVKITSAKPVSYGDVLRSTVRLFRSSSAVRVRSAYGALGFAAFSVFWSTAALQMGTPPLSYSPALIGLFGLLGAAGVMAANLTGRVRQHTRSLPTAAAISVIAGAYAVMWAGGTSLAGLVVGVLLLDIGVQGLHVLNQRIIYDVAPDARNRVNSIYMTFYFVGGSLGSAVAPAVWTAAGWPGVCVTGLCTAVLAGAVWAMTSSKKAA